MPSFNVSSSSTRVIVKNYVNISSARFVHKFDCTVVLYLVCGIQTQTVLIYRCCYDSVSYRNLLTFRGSSRSMCYIGRFPTAEALEISLALLVPEKYPFSTTKRDGPSSYYKWIRFVLKTKNTFAV